MTLVINGPALACGPCARRFLPSAYGQYSALEREWCDAIDAAVSRDLIVP
ncbi:MAG: hypothetical protein SF051_15210 [Elusimicrobiota bacterium]|nr:hypothetical protein [Elusimicrobiota bacterium]